MSALSTSRRKQAKGRKLAIAMLRKIEQDCTGSGGKGNYCIFDWIIDDDGSYQPCRDDGPQDNIVARVILQLKGDPDLIAGFGSILTDYVAGCHDGEPSTDGYSDAWWRRRMRRIARADAADERSRAALERCINGEPCPDFSLPTVKRKRRSGGSEAGEPA